MRERLILAAERVVAERGVAGATVREIHAISNARNASAVNYHYGSLEGLIKAVIEYRIASLRDDPPFDEMDAGGVVEWLVRTYSAFLNPSANDNFFLRFLHRVMIDTGPAQAFLDLANPWRDAEQRLRKILNAQLPELLAEMRISSVQGYLISELARAEAWISANPDKTAVLPMLVQSFIDSAIAIIASPVSERLSQEVKIWREQTRRQSTPR